MVVRAVAIFSLALVTACGTDPTQIMVVVRSDLAIPNELDEVRINVFGLGDQPTVDADLRAGSLPRTLALVRTGGPLGPIVVEARGYLAGALVVTRRAEVAFVEEDARMLELWLLGDCAGIECGDDTLTCTESGCASIRVGPLPPWTGDLSDASVAIDGGEDAGVDAGAGADSGGGEDAGVDSGVDGGVDSGVDTGIDTGIDTGCMTETCGNGCICSGPCPCDISCTPGADCTATCASDCTLDAQDTSNVEATCSGASCTFDVRNASNAEQIRCEAGAVCDVDCTGVSNCTVQCTGGSECTVDCSSTSNCNLNGCGSPLSCPGDVRVCNTVCP